MFKPVFIEARDLDEAWWTVLRELVKKGRRYKITSGSYEGEERIALDYVAGFIHYPHTRPLAPVIPPRCPLPAPATEESIHDYFINYLLNSKLEPNEHYKYATFIVGGEYVIPGKEEKVKVYNQLEWIIKHFLTHGLGNEHCYITIGYPESNLAYDRPYDNPNERGTSPCLRGLDFRVIDGFLTTHVIYRSWDAVNGFPVNMGGFTLLNEMVADFIGVEPGPLSFSCKSLHAYSFCEEYLKARVS